MLYPWIIGLLLLAPSMVKGQKQSIKISAHFSTDYSFRTLKKTDTSSISEYIISHQNDHDEYKFGYTAGVAMSYGLSEHFDIEGGVFFSNKGFAYQQAGPFRFGDQIDDNLGVISVPINTVEKFHNTYNYYYLDIPLRVIYSIGKKKLRLVSSVGVVTNIFLHANQESIQYYQDGSTKEFIADISNNVNRFNITPTFSLGGGYKLSEKLEIRLEPTARYGIIKIKDTPIAAYLWNIGFNISCYYNLK